MGKIISNVALDTLEFILETVTIFMQVDHRIIIIAYPDQLSLANAIPLWLGAVSIVNGHWHS